MRTNFSRQPFVSRFYAVRALASRATRDQALPQIRAITADNPFFSRATPDEHARARRIASSDRAILTAVLLVALLQGLLYLFLLPPWQHYDEPTHFEYAWLIANHGHLPAKGEVDYTMRREVAASMLEHNFYWNLARPSLLTDDREIWIGISQLADPPAYPLLVSLPLRLVRHLDVTTQLYIARSVSLVLFLLTIAIAIGVMRDLAPPGHSLRWAVPLSIVLLPSFADIMTAVNDDVGAVLVFSLFLWGAVRALRFGLTWQRLIWIIGTAILAVFTKNTASVALLLAPLVILIALWIQHGWRWRWFAAGLVGTSGLLLLAVLDWGGAAYWYPWDNLPTPPRPTRTADTVPPLGTHAIALEVSPDARARRLANPLLMHDLQSITGQTVTFGGWVWADRPAHLSTPGVAVFSGAAVIPEMITHPVSVTTTPTFVAWTFAAPEDTRMLHYVLAASLSKDERRPLRLFFDGVVFVRGAYPTDVPPIFDDTSGNAGYWGGKRFTNLVRNASAEQSWPRMRSWFSDMVVTYTQRSPSTLLTALFDVERSSMIVSQSVGLLPFDSFFTWFAWGHVRLPAPLWLFLYRGMMLLSLVGCIVWFIRYRTQAPVTLRAVLLFFVVAGLMVWLNTFARPLPLIDGWFVIPVARYAFPAIIPTMLVLAGGWWALWPRPSRSFAALGFVTAMLVLNAVAVGTIWLFYQTIPVQ